MDKDEEIRKLRAENSALKIRLNEVETDIGVIRGSISGFFKDLDLDVTASNFKSKAIQKVVPALLGGRSKIFSSLKQLEPILYKYAGN